MPYRTADRLSFRKNNPAEVNKMIGLIGAMRVEVEALQQELLHKKTETISGMTFYSGTLCGKETVIAESGIGKVFSALCAQTMILRYSVSQIINTGVGGTLTDRLSIGQIAIADSVVQHVWIPLRSATHPDFFPELTKLFSRQTGKWYVCWKKAFGGRAFPTKSERLHQVTGLSLLFRKKSVFPPNFMGFAVKWRVVRLGMHAISTAFRSAFSELFRTMQTAIPRRIFRRLPNRR